MYFFFKHLQVDKNRIHVMLSILNFRIDGQIKKLFRICYGAFEICSFFISVLMYQTEVSFNCLISSQGGHDSILI